ncbi:MAG: phage baseplate assembly protein V [Cyanobacteria bacterium P01_F01_bin.150]
MALFNTVFDTETWSKVNHYIQGVVVGTVTAIDPDRLGWVKVTFPWLSEEDESPWARVAMPMAGHDRGLYLLPEVEDEVLVMFGHGDMRFPYVIGSLWNGQDAPPTELDDGENNIRMIKSRSGHIVRLNDKDGEEKIEIIDKSENNSLVFDTVNNTITITSHQDIILDAPNGTIQLNAQTVDIASSADTGIAADGGMTITASGTMDVQGATINLN